jgi:hypothetical protein
MKMFTKNHLLLTLRHTLDYYCVIVTSYTVLFYIFVCCTHIVHLPFVPVYTYCARALVYYTFELIDLLSNSMIRIYYDLHP